jgi:9-cis-epoxycarotenoid dioxygenase
MRWMETYTTNLIPKILTDLEMFMIGNFAPTDKCPPCNNVKIVGTFLKCLNGAYVRNGNNPHHGPSSGY